MIVNRITIRNADHVYTVFFQRTFFLSGYFQERKEKRIFVFATKQRKVLSFFFPGGYSCNTRSFFYTLKERFFRALASPGGLVNVCLSFTVTKVVLFSVYANIWYYFLYSFNRYLLFKLKRKVYLHLPRFLVAFLTMEERNQRTPADTSGHQRTPADSSSHQRTAAATARAYITAGRDPRGTRPT